MVLSEKHTAKNFILSSFDGCNIKKDKHGGELANIIFCKNGYVLFYLNVSPIGMLCKTFFYNELLIQYVLHKKYYLNDEQINEMVLLVLTSYVDLNECQIRSAGLSSERSCYEFK